MEMNFITFFQTFGKQLLWSFCNDENVIQCKQIHRDINLYFKNHPFSLTKRITLYSSNDFETQNSINFITFVNIGREETLDNILSLTHTKIRKIRLFLLSWNHNHKFQTFLQTNSITSLTLHNVFDVPNLKYVCSHITTLKYFELRVVYNSINDIEPLVILLRNNPFLSVLNLRNYIIPTRSFIDTLAPELVSHNTLCELHLEDANLQDDIIDSLCDVIRGNPHITCLNVQYNEDLNGYSISKLCSPSLGLLSLNITDNSFNIESQNILITNNVLQHLEINTSNTIISHILKYNRTITSLNLTDPVDSDLLFAVCLNPKIKFIKYDYVYRQDKPLFDQLNLLLLKNRLMFLNGND